MSYYLADSVLIQHSTFWLQRSKRHQGVTRHYLQKQGRVWGNCWEQLREELSEEEATAVPEARVEGWQVQVSWGSNHITTWRLAQLGFAVW